MTRRTTRLVRMHLQRLRQDVNTQADLLAAAKLGLGQATRAYLDAVELGCGPASAWDGLERVLPERGCTEVAIPDTRRNR